MFQNRKLVIATKHQKENVIAPLFEIAKQPSCHRWRSTAIVFLSVRPKTTRHASDGGFPSNGRRDTLVDPLIITDNLPCKVAAYFRS